MGWKDLLASRYGATVSLTSLRPKSGKSCVEIRHDPNERTGMAGKVYLVQRIGAEPFRGRQVELAGWLRREVPSGVAWPVSVHLWMSCDGTPGALVDLGNSPVRSDEWTRASTTMEVPADAESISVGAMLDAAGRAWVDDLVLTRGGPIGSGNQPPRPLTQKGLDNLVAFGLLLGYVRHFHPSDASASADWDAIAMRGVEMVEEASSPGELAQLLSELIHPLAPTVRIETEPLDSAGTDLPVDDRGSSLTTNWLYRGWPWPEPGPYYTARRVVGPASAESDSMLAPGTTVDVELPGGVWSSVPLVLNHPGDDSFPPSPSATGQVRPSRPRGWVASANDRATRLAGVLLCWNVLQHFYPNFEYIDRDWRAALRSALSEAAVDADPAAFTGTLRRLGAQLEDGHFAVTPPYRERAKSWPVMWGFVEDRLVITQLDSALAAPARLGDEIVALQGEPTAHWIDLAKREWRASTPARTLLLVARALTRYVQGDTLRLKLRGSDGAERVAHLQPAESPKLQPQRPSPIEEMRPSVFYVDLTRVSAQALANALPDLARGKGIIFDLRGYPSGHRTFVAKYLTDSTVASYYDLTPVITRPDHKGVSYEKQQVVLAPDSLRISGRVAFLADERAQSMAETMLAPIEVADLAAIVGSSTSGSSGNVTWLKIPGGFTVTFSGAKVVKPDGSRFVGVGIQPTVRVTPTLQGVAEGRDEVLERALNLVEGEGDESSQ